MGVYVTLCWEDRDGAKQFHSCFKLSSYPWQLHPDGLEDGAKSTYSLRAYFAWLKHVRFILEKLPDAYMRVNRSSNSLHAIQDFNRQDIEAMKEAIQKAQHLKKTGLKTWVAVG